MRGKPGYTVRLHEKRRETDSKEEREEERDWGRSEEGGRKGEVRPCSPPGRSISQQSYALPFHPFISQPWRADCPEGAGFHGYRTKQKETIYSNPGEVLCRRVT